MSLAFIASNENPDAWVETLEKYAGETIEVWPHISDPAAIEYVFASAPPKGALASLPNVKAVLSLWAGIEHITSDPDFPTHLPIIRMVDIGLADGMKEYVMAHVLFHHLNGAKWHADKVAKRWEGQDPPLAPQRKIGVLGLGELGRYCAEALKMFGFDVSGWSRSQKEIDGITCFSGDAGLEAMLCQTEIVVNLLPHTAATTKLLNTETLAMMPTGTAIVNPGRGTIFDDDALISALDSKHISAVTLDVFWQEPLPKDHAFWDHPQVFITPHVASVTRVDTGAKSTVDNLKHLRAGKDIAMLKGVVNPSVGY